MEGMVLVGDVQLARQLAGRFPRAFRRAGEEARAHHQRSDVCAVPAAGVVAEAMVALVLAGCVLEKFGGDSLGETAANFTAYLERVRARGLEVARE